MGLSENGELTQTFQFYYRENDDDDDDDDDRDDDDRENDDRENDDRENDDRENDDRENDDRENDDRENDDRENDDRENDDRENDDDKILMYFKREDDYEPLKSGYLIYPQRLCVLSISHRVSRVLHGTVCIATISLACFNVA